MAQDADYTSIVADLVTFFTTELSAYDSGVSTFSASATTPTAIDGNYPLMWFQPGGEGGGWEQVGIPSTFDETHWVDGMLALGLRSDLAGLAALETEYRKWPRRVKIAQRKHYQLGGDVFRFHLDTYHPGTIKLNDTDHVLIRFPLQVIAQIELTYGA